MREKLLLQNGLIIDGTGQAGFHGDLLVENGRINAIYVRDNSPSISEDNVRVLDCEGLIICPGFIDAHSHADFVLPFENHTDYLKCMLEQGVTTVIAGNCGFSPAPLSPRSPFLDIYKKGCEFVYQRDFELEWDSLESYFNVLNRQGLILNLAQLIGHGTLRWSLWGKDYKYPGQAGMAQMKRIVQQSFDAGAFGLSFGLGYEPGMYVASKELEEIASWVKEQDKILAIHGRAFGIISPAYSPLKRDHNLIALKEIINLARKTEVRTQISHLIFVGTKTWRSCERALEMIDEARRNGVDITFDTFPYFCGPSTVHALFPGWFLQGIEKRFNKRIDIARLKLEYKLMQRILGFGTADIQIMWGGHKDLERYNGWFLDRIAEDMRCSSIDALVTIARLSKGAASCLMYKYTGDEEDESNYISILKHPLGLIETDALINMNGLQQPSAYGTFPRVIQRYHKELGVLSLEETIARMTGQSARRFGLRDRGTIRVGAWADITVIDYTKIRDNTNTKKTDTRPDGIMYVFINGEQVVKDGCTIPGKKSGKLLRTNE